jgi:hypothetical protein
MSQSEIIAGALFGAFVVYLAMNGKLSAYWSVLMGGTPSGGSGAAAPPSGGTTGSGGSTLPKPGSSGRPTFQVIPDLPGLPGSGLTITLPPNPLPTPSPGTGFGGFN